MAVPAVAVPLPLDIAIIVMLIGIAYAGLVVVLQRKLVNQNRMRELQQKIKLITKEMQEMAKRKEDASAKQKELMPLMNESMKSQFKSMFVVLPIFFVLYYVLIPNIFSAFNGDVYNFFVPLTYANIFFVAAFASGLVLSLAVQLLYRKQAKAANAQKQQQESEMKSGEGLNTPATE
jgi:uncharacterized membrane protein (DUF106 family)